MYPSGSESDYLISSRSGDDSAVEDIIPMTIGKQNSMADLDTDDSGSITGNHSDSETGDLKSSLLDNSDKDSGMELSPSDQEVFVVPNIELMGKIINQVEFYFSNENILRDPFLLKHVRRNKQGFVSLKLISTFRKMKSITKNWEVVAYSLKHSTKLEVNQQKTKVRRVESYPDYDETYPSRTLLLSELPFEKVTMENVGELVSKYGDVVSLHILKPGVALSPDVKELKKFLIKHPELTKEVCAVVEFDKHASASNALKDLSSPKDNWRAVKVQPMVKRSDDKSMSSPLSASPATETKLINPLVKQKSVTLIDAKDFGQAPIRKESVTRAAPPKKRKNKKTSVISIKSELSRRSSDFDNSHPASSCSESEQYSPEARRRSSGSVSSGYSSSPRTHGDHFPVPERRNTVHHTSVTVNRLTKTVSASNAPGFQRRAMSLCSSKPLLIRGSGDASEHNSPWVQRRILHATNSSSNLLSHSRTLVPEGVTRLPLGPDGTKGFHKPRAVTIA